MDKRKLGNRPPNQPTDFGSVLYKRVRKLTETRMSEIWFAQRQDGSPVIAKFAMVNEERLAALLMNRGAKGNPEHISEFVQEKNQNIRQAIHNNRDDIRRHIEVNQAAIANEATCWLQLQKPGHPGIIRLYPVVNKTSDTDAKYYERSNLPGNPYFLVSEYMPGGTLRDLIGKHKGLTVERSIEILHAIGEVLAYVHEKGFVHLDIKPQNIVFGATPTPNQPIAAARPTLIDFGICSKEGMPGGGTSTQWWSEPRRWVSRSKGDLMVHRGMDIYSVAMMLRYMLTGEFPQIVNNNGFAAPLHKALAINDLRFDAKVSPEKRTLIAKQLNGLINSCLADDPTRRPDMTQIRQKLEQVQAVIGVPKRQTSTRRMPSWRGALIAVASLVVVLAAYFVISGQLSEMIVGMPPNMEKSPTPPSAVTDMPAPVAGMITDTVTSVPPTLMAASTLTPTVTATWTETPTTVPTVAATATPLPPTSTSPMTATPLPLPTSTAQPTATSMPTSTSMPTVTSSPTPRPAPGPNLGPANVTNLQKNNEQICNGTWRGKVTFRWTVDSRFRLPAGYGYDVVIWAPNKEDPFKVDGIMGATASTEVEIDADSVIDSRNINTDLPYQIAVFLGQYGTPQQKYKRIHLMGPANCLFNFE